MDIFDTCIEGDSSTSTNPNPRTTTLPSSIDVTADLFESTLTLEETRINQGYTDGYTAGLALGLKDGYDVGLKHGLEVGEELGFYRGLVDVWASAIRVSPCCFSTRVERMVQRMGELLDRYPVLDPDDEGVDEIKMGLRSKFRAVCGSLGVRLEYDGYPRFSDGSDTGF